MPNSDLDIIRRILAGETRAYAELVDRHKDKAMTLALRMLRNREDAEEALQDAFVRAFKALERFEMKASFATWFYRIVFNVCSSALGKRAGISKIPLHEAGAEALLGATPTATTPEIDFESSAFEQAVHQEIENLPPAYASVLTLFFVQELSYEEIVEVTGMPLGTVKNRLFRARMLLRDAVIKKVPGCVEEKKYGRIKLERPI